MFRRLFHHLFHHWSFVSTYFCHCYLFPPPSTIITCSHLPIPTYFHYHRLLLHIFVIVINFCMPTFIIITCSCLPTSVIVASSTTLFVSSPICLPYCLHVWTLSSPPCLVFLPFSIHARGGA
jgi:hypothetical protein